MTTAESELSNAKRDLADLQTVIGNQDRKVRELEQGKPLINLSDLAFHDLVMAEHDAAAFGVELIGLRTVRRELEKRVTGQAAIVAEKQRKVDEEKAERLLAVYESQLSDIVTQLRVITVTQTVQNAELFTPGYGAGWWVRWARSTTRLNAKTPQRLLKRFEKNGTTK